MRLAFAILVGLLGAMLLTEEVAAQSKTRGKSKTATTDKKKKSDLDKPDTVLEERTITTKLETPRTRFVVNRMYPDVKVDFNKFGDLSEAMDGDAQRALYRNKYEEKPEKMSADDVVDRIRRR